MHHFFAYIDRMRYIERWALMLQQRPGRIFRSTAIRWRCWLMRWR